MGRKLEQRLLNLQGHPPALNTTMAGTTDGWILIWNESAAAFDISSSGASSAASYVTLGLHASLSAERVLTPGAGVTWTDGGANAAITLGLGFTSEAQGDVITRGGSNWQRLGAAITGSILSSGGTSGNAFWGALPGGTWLGTWVDSSSYVHTVTPLNSPTQAKTNVKIGVGSADFVGSSGQYLSVPHHTSMNFGTGDFTMEGWFFPETFEAAGTMLFGKGAAGGANSGWKLYLTSVQSLKFQIVELGVQKNAMGSSGGAVATNAWQHIAACRVGNTLTLFVDGTSVTS